MAQVVYAQSQKQRGAVRQENQCQRNDVKQVNDVAQLEVQHQILKQKQSQEMVQIMLHVSLGTLFYLRDFLPISCFEDRDIVKLAHRDTPISYSDFIENKRKGGTEDPGSKSPFVTKRGQPLKVLVRNRDEHADAILDLLENGIFEAIGKSVLEAVQFTTFVDKDVPSNVLESYTFTFKYTGGLSDVNNRLASISLEQTGCTADMKTTRSAKFGLQMIVRRLIILSALLPTLPNKRFLGIHLFYSEDCPPEYEPPGFARSTDDRLLFPHGEDWTKESQVCGTLDSGFHSVGLKVTSIQWSGADQSDPGSIPHDIQYSTAISREEDIGIEQDANSQALQSEPRLSQQSTQTRQDTVAKRMLEKMVAPSTPDSALIPTQPAEDSLESVVQGNTATGFTNPQLSQAKLSGLEKQHVKQTPVSLGRKARSDKGGDGAVDCQCGWKKEEGGMIQCYFCQTWQHIPCYGFLDPDDPNIPDTHACYKCLLEPHEAPLFREMGTLVLLRRALAIIMKEGYPNRARDFSQKLHCNGHTVVQVTDLLKKQGLLRATPGSNSRGFSQKGLPRFSVPDSAEVRERLQREIFDPFVKIAHHYTFSGASQLISESPMPSAPAQLSKARADGTGIPSSSEDSQLDFLSDGSDTREYEQHGDVTGVADSGDRNQGSGAWDTGSSRHGSKRSSSGAVEGLPRNSVPRQTGSGTSTDAASMDTTCKADGQGGVHQRPGKRRKMSNVVQSVKVAEHSDAGSP